MSLELHINSTSLKWIFELHELLAQGKKQLNQWMNSMISKSCLVFWLVCTSHHFGAEGESVAFNVCWIAHTASFVPFVVQRQLESWFRGESEDWSYRCWLRAFGQTNIGKELPAWGNFELRCGSSLLQVALGCHCIFFFLWLLLEFAAIDVEEERAFLIWSLPFVLFQQNIHRYV